MDPRQKHSGMTGVFKSAERFLRDLNLIMSTYQLSIVTPNGAMFDEAVQSLVAPGTEGSFGILAQHAPMVASLKMGPLTVKQDQIEKFFALKAGVLEVGEDSHVLILCDEAILVESKEAAKEQIKIFGDD